MSWFRRQLCYGFNPNPSLGWPWTLTLITDAHKRLSPHELSLEWGEAIWTARDIWEVK